MCDSASRGLYALAQRRLLTTVCVGACLRLRSNVQTVSLKQYRANSIVQTMPEISSLRRLRFTEDHCPSCCAAFALGSNGGIACPASYARLDTADACKSAADAASKTYGGNVAY